MAKMIPDREPSNPGERDVFRKLRAGPDDWTCFHSVSGSYRRRSYEVDFVLVTQRGVICLEVKGGRNYDLISGIWYDSGNEEEPPYEQVKKNAYDLKNHKELELFLQWAVIFTQSDMTAFSGSWPNDVTLIDVNTFSEDRRFYDELERAASIRPAKRWELDDFLSILTPADVSTGNRLQYGAQSYDRRSSQASRSRSATNPQRAASNINEGALQSLVNDFDQHLERGAQVKQEVENLLTGHPNWHVLHRIRPTLNSFRVQSRELQQRSFRLYQGTPKRQVLVDRANLLAVFLSTLEPLEKLTGELLDNMRKFPDDLKQHAEEGKQIQREVENRLKGHPVLSDLEIVLRRIGRYWLTQDELRSKSSSLYQGSSRPQNVTVAERRLEDIYPALRELEELVKHREAEQRKAEFPEDLRRHLGEGERIRTDATTILAGRPSLPDLEQILEELDHYWSIQDTLKQKVSGLYGDHAELPLPVRLNEKLIEDLRLPLRRLAAQLEDRVNQQRRYEQRKRILKRSLVFASVALALFALGALGWQSGVFDGNGAVPAAPAAPAAAGPIAARPAPVVALVLPTSTHTPTPTPTSTFTSTSVPVPTHTPLPSPTPTFTLTPTSTYIPTQTATRTPTLTPAPTIPRPATATPVTCSEQDERLVKIKDSNAPYCITADGIVGPPPTQGGESARPAPEFTPTPSLEVQATQTSTSTAASTSENASDPQRCEEENWQPGANLSGCNLSGKDMSRRDLTGAIFANSVLASTNLEEAILKGADLTDVNLIGADLTGADLTNAELAGADMTNVSAEGIVLASVNLSSTTVSGIASFNNAVLKRVTFPIGAQLMDVTFHKADLHHTKFIDAELESADFTGATFYRTDFRRANLKRAIFGRPSGEKELELDDVILNGADLQEATLKNVVFSEYTFDQINEDDPADRPSFRNTDLSNAVFFNANLSGFDFSYAKLTDASFRNAVLTSANFANADDIEDADFSKADLTGANFTGARNVEEARFDDTVCSDGVESDDCYLEGRLHGMRP